MSQPKYSPEEIARAKELILLLKEIRDEHRAKAQAARRGK